jgi:hypothetical protein
MVKFSDDIHREAWNRTSPEFRKRLVENSMFTSDNYLAEADRTRVAAMHFQDLFESVESFAELNVPENRTSN